MKIKLLIRFSIAMLVAIAFACTNNSPEQGPCFVNFSALAGASDLHLWCFCSG